MFFERLKASFRQFMIGRNGVDPLSIFLLFAGFVLAIITSFIRIPLLSMVSTVLYFLSLFRIFSRNTAKRAEELQKYEALRTRFMSWLTQQKNRAKNRKEYKYFHCPGCKTLLRMRRGRGEIDMRCPKCGHTFKTRS